MFEKKYTKLEHLTYRISKTSDIVHPFSPSGYELVTEEFMSYMELIRPTIPADSMILMEFTGTDLSEEEKSAIDRAIWVHYRLKLTRVKNLMKECRLKALWLLVCFLVSSFLLFAARRVSQEVVIQYAYLPFWFFAYRLADCIVFQYPDFLREKSWAERVGAMKLLFSKEPGRALSEEEITAAKKEIRGYICEAEESIRRNALIDKYFMEDGVLALECVAESAADLTRSASVEGHELISDELASYLMEAEPFVRTDVPIQLTIKGCRLDQAQLSTVTAALRNYFRMVIADVDAEIRKNNRKIAVFAIGLLLSSIMLVEIGKRVDVAAHEGIVILFWFFGDYLVEYILLAKKELDEEKKKWMKILGMSVFAE